LVKDAREYICLIKYSQPENISIYQRDINHQCLLIGQIIIWREIKTANNYWWWTVHELQL